MKIKTTLIAFLFTLVMGTSVALANEPPPDNTPPPDIIAEEHEKNQAASAAIEKTLVRTDLLPNMRNNVKGGCKLTPEYADKLVKAARSLKEKRPELILVINSCWWSYETHLRILKTRDGDAISRVGRYDTTLGHYAGKAVDVDLVNGLVRAPLPRRKPAGSSGSTGRCGEAKTPEQRENCEALGRAMHEAGFYGLDREWWHFDDVPRDDQGRPLKKG